MPIITDHPRDYKTLEEHVAGNDLPPPNMGLFHDSQLLWNAFETLKKNPSLLLQVCECLGELGLHRFSYWDHGRFALVFRTVDNQLIRISRVAVNERERIHHPAILQAIWRKEIFHDSATIRIEVLPYLDQSRVTDAHVKELRNALEESGIRCGDLKKDNIALLKDGTPVLIDAGFARMSGDKPFTKEGSHLKPWFTEVETPQGVRTVWKQHAFHPAIESGLISGVISADAIRRIETRLSPDNPLMEAIREEGYYKADFDQVFADAVKTYFAEAERGQPRALREIMREQRAKYDKRQSPKRGR